MQGLILHDIPNIGSRISGKSPWAFQLKDFSANEVGIRHAENARNLINK